VQHFYLYYNGLLRDLDQNTKDFCANKADITLIEWNYRYWNPKNYMVRHHAQMGQMHHALYKYGKQNSKYMIFCDFDEYMKVNIKLIDLIKSGKELYGFRNVWSNTLDNKIPKEIPNKILTGGVVCPWGHRSKNVIRTDAIDLMAVHEPRNFDNSRDADKNNVMFHFYSWCKTDRSKPRTESDIRTRVDKVSDISKNYR
jgi:hypothetical protein